MKTSQTQILVATQADVAELNTLVNSAYRGDTSKQGWTTEADVLDGIRIDVEKMESLILKKDSYILKAVDQKKITGCVHLEKHGEKCYLGMLTVNPTTQNSGLGKKLLQASEEFASKKMNCQNIYMTVISIREELLQWYFRRGYGLTGERKPFPMDDPRFGVPKINLEFLVLEKNL